MAHPVNAPRGNSAPQHWEAEKGSQVLRKNCTTPGLIRPDRMYMRTSKSARRIQRFAYDSASRALPAYRQKYSPKKFAQP